LKPHGNLHDFEEIWLRVKPYCLTGKDKAFELYKAVISSALKNTLGDIIICGPWQGGPAFLVALTISKCGLPVKSIRILHGDAEFFFSNGFVGVADDIKKYDANMMSGQNNISIWPEFTGQLYDKELFNEISILFIDTIMFNSNPTVMADITSKCTINTIKIIDAFVSDCSSSHNNFMCVDQAPLKIPGYPSLSDRYDYLAPNIVNSNLIVYFPSLVSRDPAEINWPYLRKEVSHKWRSDTRSLRYPDTGVQSVEEAELLYNNALQFAGKRGLEIGCHYGWSTAHLLLAGLHLDVIDPALGFEDQSFDVTDSLEQIPTAGSFRLWAGYSPSITPAIANMKSEKWSFIFIDGYHEGRAPIEDSEGVLVHCADDACVMFHDLTSPFVAAGLRYFSDKGWNIAIYETMQIMGIAWRGIFEPVSHLRDKNIPATSLPHLEGIKSMSI
jgi:Methyltransferase domain